MRLFIRNKVKYDPLHAGKPLVFVEIPDPRGFSVGQVKEEFKKKVRAAKVDSLYHRQADGSYEVLADDRTVGFYNIQDNAILETTSNPLWAATIYYRLREVERDAAANQLDDARTNRGLEQSVIQKYMALGILFNGGNNPERQHPPFFEELDQLYEHLQTAGKKPVHMSQRTLDTLQTLKDEYEQNDIHEKDAIGHFVNRQAAKLGLVHATSSNVNGDSGTAAEVQRVQVGGRGKGNRVTVDKGKRPAATGRGGRKAPQKQRTCEDCEENVATHFCADCQPPLVLCDDCAAVLHRGARRRNHQLKDVTEAPTPSKGYTPKAYRAPFAMLVAFHSLIDIMTTNVTEQAGLIVRCNEVPSKMSLTADELKSKAQPLTNTDLEIKQGRWFGGFDSLENALMKNELVRKEARNPKYSLMEKGQALAARCSEFDYAVQNLTQAASVPTIPVTGARPVLRNRQVCLLVDSEEPLRERFVRVAQQRGLSARTRKLPVGDFLWVLLAPGVNPDTVRDMPEQELVLPMVVERKTWDDLWSSLKTTRFEKQVQRMKKCGLENLYYLVEGSPKELKGNPGPEVELYLQDKIDSLLLDEQFLVNRTGSWLKSVEWLCHLTNMSIEFLQSGEEPKLMTYHEFSHSTKLRRNLSGTLHATPATVWSATEFADVIRSHKCGGRVLHDLLVREGEERSLVVIQGLTLYNKQRHKVLDKALAGLLENTHQTADAAVQKHLEGVTDQLIPEDVTQWYILWLQVFKGAMVRRTETEEESAEILCKFYQNISAAADVLPYFDDHVRPVMGEAEQKLERLPDEDLLFANDSQEEGAMIRQALRASQYEEKMPSEDVSHLPPVIPPTSSTTRGPVPSISDDGAQRFSLSEEEQLELALKLSAAENAMAGHCKSPVTTGVKPFESHKHKSSSHNPIFLNSKTEVSDSGRSADCVDKKGNGSTDCELEEVLKLSLEEFKSERQRQVIKDSVSGDMDNDLEKALELSRIEYEQSKRMEGSKMEKHDERFGTSFVRDTQLQTALELSEMERGAKDKEQGTPGSQDSDLERALVLSRIEFTQGGYNSLNKVGKCSDSDVVIVEKSQKVLPSRGDEMIDSYIPSSVPSDDDWEERSSNHNHGVFGALSPNSKGNSKDCAILLDSQEPLDDTEDDFEFALKVQEDLNKEVKASPRHHHDSSDKKVTTGSKLKEQIIDCTEDDFAFALKVQEDLNKEVKARPRYPHDSPDKKATSSSKLQEQIVGYRKSQKEKFSTCSGQREKSSSGVDFRKNVAAIACGKPVKIGVASPISRPCHESAKVLGGRPASLIGGLSDRSNNGSLGSPRKRFCSKDDVCIVRDDITECKAVGMPSSSSLEKSSVRTPLCQAAISSSPRPFSPSSSTFERVHRRISSSLSGPCSSSPSTGSSSVMPFSSGLNPATQCKSSGDKPVGPKCGACGEIGHNKNSKICPQYFSEEAVQRREEQSRKRKAKREEEEREVNDQLGALAAQRVLIEDRTRVLAEEQEQLRQQLQNMASTQKKVEDAIKKRRKR